MKVYLWCVHKHMHVRMHVRMHEPGLTHRFGDLKMWSTYPRSS